jgi:ATP-binding protein involved in chromosome partitioning
VDVLAKLPLDLTIREMSDAGTPITAAMPDSEQAKAYLALAETVIRKIKKLNSRKVSIPVVQG